VITIPIILVYIATCISVPFFYRREQPTEFSVFRHIILPVIPVLVLLAVIYSQVKPLLVPPYPAVPINYAVPIVAAWFLIGLIVVIILQVRTPEVLRKAVGSTRNGRAVVSWLVKHVPGGRGCGVSCTEASSLLGTCWERGKQAAMARDEPLALPALPDTFLGRAEKGKVIAESGQVSAP